jgi:hypothetical protein
MIIKENLIYYFIFLFGYGVFGAGIAINNNLEIFYLLTPLIFFSLIFILNNENETILHLKKETFTSIKIAESIYLIIIFVFLLYLVNERIFLSIADDEYAYSSLGLIHSNFIISSLSNYELLKEISVKKFYHFFSLTILLSIIFYIYCINKIFKNKIIYQVLAILFTVLIARYVIFKFGGNPFPHPPLLAISSLISTALFGLSDLSIKFIPFLIYNLFAYYYFFKLRKYINDLISLLIVLGLFSIPGVLYMSTLIEQSLFSMICFSIIGIELTTNSKPNYKKLFIIILFFSLFRVLSILALILIAFHIVLNSNSLKNFFENSILATKKAYPLLLFLPFIFFSFTFDNDLTVNRVGLSFLNIKFFTHILPLVIIDNFTFFVGILLFIFLLGLIYFWKKTFFLIGFLIICLVVYGNVIAQDNKYSYEIFFPIILSFLLIYYSSIKKIWSKNLLSFLIVLIIFSNIFILKKFSSFCLIKEKPFNNNHTYEVKFGCNIIYAHPFDLKSSFIFLKKHDEFSFENLYIPGVYYGLLPSIINGIKISEYEQHKKINSEQNKLNVLHGINWISAEAKNINKDKNIKFVLVADLENSEKLINELILSGWSKINENINPNFKTISVILFKKN